MISNTVLMLAESFSGNPNAKRVVGALGNGLEASGRIECDLCPLEEGTNDARALLDALDFDRRMRAARAIVIACERLDDRTLAGSIVFEAATRARQSGVPAYAVTAENELDLFEARIIDLQVILHAATPRALGLMGRKLAAIV